MPVTLNAPPFPMADNKAVSAADKTADDQDAPRDAFAALLHAAGHAPSDAGKDAATATTTQTDASGAASIDQQLQQQGVARGARGKPPLLTLPIVGRDPALKPDAAKPGALVDTSASDKAAPDKPAPSDAVGAGLAGMTAMLSALLGNHARPDPAAPDVSDGAQARSIAVASGDVRADASRARDDKAQANIEADPTDVPQTVTSVTSAALQASALREADDAGKSGTTKPDALEAPGAPQPVALFQHGVGPVTSQPITIATPVTAPGFQNEFADKLTQVVMTGNDRAEFRLHPANMGPVDVKISVSSDQASVLITAPHAATRDALEQALPQLRELLASQGITLGQASVQSENRPSDPGPQTRDSSQVADKPAIELPVRVVRLNGLVDVFA